MAFFGTHKARIMGCSLVLGELEKNIDNEPMYFANDIALLGRLKNTIGMGTRYIAANDTTTSDLCIEAAEKLLEALHLSVNDIHFIIFLTQTPDYLMPGNAHVVHRKMGFPDSTGVLDCNMGCSGFVHGLGMATSLAEKGVGNILLLVGDTLSKCVDTHDRTLAPLFGDAGSATIISSTHDVDDTLYFLFGADGSGLETMFVPSGGCRNPIEDNADNEGKNLQKTLQMDGFGIFKFSMTRQPQVMSEALAYVGVTADEIDYFLLHQANRYIVQTITSKAGIPEAKAPADIFTRYGNLNAASIPAILCADLAETLNQGKLRVLMQGFGIGLSWGVCITTLNGVLCLPPCRREIAHA